MSTWTPASRGSVIAARLLRGLGIAVVVIWSLLPIALVVSSSLKQARDIFVYPPVLIFRPTLEHYFHLFEQWPDYLKYFGNSLIISTAATLLAVLSSTLAGYVYSRYRSRLLDASLIFLIAVRLLPPIVITLPLFPLADFFKLSDTHLLLILLYATFFVSLNTMIMRTFIDGIPAELDDAAKVDGASELQILFRIILPMAAPGMVAAAVFVFIYSWNEFLFAFIFTTSHAKTTPLIISELMSSLTGVDWGMLFAAVSVQLLPIAIFIVLMQRFLVAGLTAGSVKG
jgi:multiple sugar transport system permease protein